MIERKSREGGEPELLCFAAGLEPLVRQIGHGPNGSTIARISRSPIDHRCGAESRERVLVTAR
jgi:hypothetical protein